MQANPSADCAHSSVVAGVWNTLVDFNLTVVTLIAIHAGTGVVAKPVLRISDRAHSVMNSLKSSS